jgi:hypothetical protein
MRYRATIHTAAAPTMPIKIRGPNVRVLCPARDGTRTSIGTIAKSWKRRMPSTEPALGRVRLAAPDEDREHHRGRGERDQHREEDRVPERVSLKSIEKARVAIAMVPSTCNGPGHQKRAADLLQPGERELEPDHEEEHRDADLGQDGDVVRIAHEPECARADQNAGEHEPDRGRELEPPARHEHEERRRQGDDEIAEEGGFVHGWMPRNGDESGRITPSSGASP